MNSTKNNSNINTITRYYKCKKCKDFQSLNLANNIMRIKCLIYPYVTIFYWLFAATYRIVYDTVMMKYDSGNNPLKRAEDERKLFKKYPFFQIIVQFFLVIHTFLSSTRGIFYGL